MNILVIFACLASAPETCVREQFAYPMPLTACLTASQPAAASWAHMHPDYEVRMIRCEADRSDHT